MDKTSQTLPRPVSLDLFFSSNRTRITVIRFDKRPVKTMYIFTHTRTRGHTHTHTHTHTHMLRWECFLERLRASESRKGNIFFIIRRGVQKTHMSGRKIYKCSITIINRV